MLSIEQYKIIKEQLSKESATELLIGDYGC